ncbi:MAG: PQQ-binding-like beta-propeller repeat protein [Planctomycetes bacterium]|nr:PQQ-binding-like beta-propeller repeat protein [Planctomycetota bacterium]
MKTALPIALCVLINTARAADWPQLLGPNRDGVSAEHIIDHFPAGGPHIDWRIDVGAGFAGPAVSGEHVLVFDRIDNTARLRSLDAASGKVQWTFTYPTRYVDNFGFDNGPRAVPTIEGDRVYTYGAEGMIHCLDLATGRIIWSLDTVKQFRSDKGFFGRAGAPIIVGDVLVLNVGGNDEAGIVGLDKRTGELRYKVTSDAAGYSSPTSGVIDGQPAALVLTRERLVAIDPAGGAMRFEFPFRSDQDASVNAAVPLVFAGDRVFLSASYGTGATLLHIEKDQPRVVWHSDEALSAHYPTPVHRDGYLYGSHGRFDMPPGSDLRCIELATGKVMWSTDTVHNASLLLATDRLILLTDRGDLILADASPTAYRETAHAHLFDATVRAYPALAHGHLFARDEQHLLSIDLTDDAAK